MDSLSNVLAMLGKLSVDSPKCSNPSCAHKNVCKSCSACGIVSYCCKDCQMEDWKRHKRLCIECRPFKNCPTPMSLQQKTALDEDSMVKLPPVDAEYQRKFGYSGIIGIYLKGGLMATQEMISTNIANLNKEDEAEDVQNLLKRWQEVSPALWDFVEDAQPGDIFLKKRYQPYSPGAPQQFRNTPLVQPLKLNGGTTVVEIGFVDFGMAFDSITTLDVDEDKPLNVVGYEASPHCVAKTHVMLQMMKNAKVDARSVIEVWLSSLWSEQTYEAFKKAVKELRGHSYDFNREVKLILKYWDKASRTSKESALRFQLKGALKVPNSTAMMNCCSLKNEADRVDFIRYFITKALYEDGSTTVGSVVMNNEKEQIGVMQLFESCFEAAPYSIHHTVSSDESFIGRMKRYFETSMQKFMFHIRNGSLVFTPKLNVLSQQNSSLIQEIKGMDPYLIHWSNVVDYLHPKEFHTIAKEISGSDTVHIVHSCNWTSRVMGTDIYDINPLVRLYYYAAGLMTMKMFTDMTEGIATNAPSHFRNTCGIVLARKYVKKFFQYFFKDEEVNCGSLNGKTPLTAPFPFLRANVTAHFMFTYKSTGVTFSMDAYDYLNDDE